jgi:hypothetical protein
LSEPNYCSGTNNLQQSSRQRPCLPPAISPELRIFTIAALQNQRLSSLAHWPASLLAVHLEKVYLITGINFANPHQA